MVQTIKQACVFSPIVHDYRMAQAIENLADLIGVVIPKPRNL